jgi:transcriptional regulator with GAF, ATPase, and Fis domain
MKKRADRTSFPLIGIRISELFGHVKEHYFGGKRDRAGKFEAADKGTIFFDEIGDMSLSAQAKVLLCKMITRVGADKDKSRCTCLLLPKI